MSEYILSIPKELEEAFTDIMNNEFPGIDIRGINEIYSDRILIEIKVARLLKLCEFDQKYIDDNCAIISAAIEALIRNENLKLGELYDVLKKRFNYDSKGKVETVFKTFTRLINRNDKACKQFISSLKLKQNYNLTTKNILVAIAMAMIERTI